MYHYQFDITLPMKDSDPSRQFLNACAHTEQEAKDKLTSLYKNVMIHSLVNQWELSKDWR
jgi:hypothetical protein